MKDATKEIYNELFLRYPILESCLGDIGAAFEALTNSFRHRGKLLVCGNGGSAADAEHIAGELLNKFKKRRPLPHDIAAKLPLELSSRLVGALPVISLVSMTGFLSAAANDIDWCVAYAQEAVGLANEGDVLLAISTSGNSSNCVAAAQVVKAKGGVAIALTGSEESRLSEVCDVTIRVPENVTFKIQELHLPVYHTLCAMLEEELFCEGA